MKGVFYFKGGNLRSFTKSLRTFINLKRRDKSPESQPGGIEIEIILPTPTKMVSDRYKLILIRF